MVFLMLLGCQDQINVSLSDGEYVNEIDDSLVKVDNGKIEAPRNAYIFIAASINHPQSISSELLDGE